MSACDFLLVIPAFREHHRLPPFLAELTRVLSDAPFTTEIVIVDDGSPEKERKEMLAAVHTGAHGRCHVREPILLPSNQGKGAAILAGWKSASESHWVSFVDADGAIPPYEVLRLFRMAMEEMTPTCLFAARIRMLGRKIERSFSRHLRGRVFAAIVRKYLHSSVYDIQCGFKIIPSEFLLKVQPSLQGSGFCFDVELFLALQSTGAKVVEVPIDWEDKQGGHVNVLRDGLKMLFLVWMIRNKRALGQS